LRLIRSILAIVILSLLVCLVYLSLDWQSLKRAVVDADIYLLFLMLLAWGMLLLIRPLRLLVILKAMNPETQVKYGTITKANILAVASNNLLPARAGDLLMVLILSNSSIKMRHTVPATVMEKGIDFAAALFLFLGVLALLPISFAWVTTSAYMLLLGLFLALISGCLLVSRAGAFLWLSERLFERVSFDRRVRWQGWLIDMSSGLSAAGKPIVLLKVLALTTAIWWFTVTFFWLGARSVGAEISLVAAAFTAGAVSLSFLAPITPGGLGVFHAVIVVSLSLFEVPLAQGIACGILAHGLPFLGSMILGYAISILSGVGIGFLTQRRKNDDG
jgi:hypothetical protein